MSKDIKIGPREFSGHAEDGAEWPIHYKGLLCGVIQSRTRDWAGVHLVSHYDVEVWAPVGELGTLSEISFPTCNARKVPGAITAATPSPRTALAQAKRHARHVLNQWIQERA